MKLFKNNSKISYFIFVTLFIDVLFFNDFCCYAQDQSNVSFGNVSVNDFNINSSLIDVNTTAVVIADIGEVKFEGNSKGWFAYIYKRKTRIKILNKKAFDLATVKIHLYQRDDEKEKVEKISAVCYNLENGNVTETKLNKKDIFEIQSDKNIFSENFSVPGVKEGSIIEYSFTVKSNFAFDLPSWEFQNDECPVLWSEYSVNIPSLLSYLSIFQGEHSFFINSNKDGYQDFLIKRAIANGSYGSSNEEMISVSSPTILHRWVMKDIPAFKAENYISSSQNYIDKVSLQLYETFDGEKKHDVANSWKKVSEELLERDDFGKPLKQSNNWMDDILNNIMAATDDNLAAAKKIFYYVQNNFTCTDVNNKYIKTTLKDFVKNKSGSVGDINLFLTALLKHKKLIASPVLLSTRAFGRNNPSYPLLEGLNYTICKATINGVDYYLDATEPFIGFGKLPQKCYNGYARVISTDSSSINLSSDSITETSMTSVFVSNSVQNQLEGSYTKNFGYYKSLSTKKEYAGTSTKSYTEKLKESIETADLQIDSVELTSLKSKDEPVTLKYNFKLKSFDNNEIIYYTPMMGETIKTNPFAAAERINPVEMPFKINDLFVLDMEIPKGYKVEELPKSTKVSLNENEGTFEYLISSDKDKIQMKCHLVLRKANFTKEDYQTLRDFYSLVVKKESEQIVFKKIK